MHQKAITDKWLENELTRWWLADLRVSVFTACYRWIEQLTKLIGGYQKSVQC